MIAVKHTNIFRSNDEKPLFHCKILWGFGKAYCSWEDGHGSPYKASFSTKHTPEDDRFAEIAFTTALDNGVNRSGQLVETDLLYFHISV